MAHPRTRPFVPTPGDEYLFGGLMSSWLLALEAENKSPRTLDNYRCGPVRFAEWLSDQGRSDDLEALDSDTIRAWLAHVSARQSEWTARSRYMGLRQFVRWLLEEGELDSDPMANVKQPTVRDQEMQLATPDTIRALLSDCDGKDFASVRDRAIVLLFADTGMRLSSLADLTESDIDLRDRVVRIVGKGGRRVTVAIGATTARALDRYLRAKRREPYGDREWLWISSTGKGKLTANGAYQILRRRGRRLGITLHPHMFRHGFADAWLRAGGNEGDLMELMGWSSRQMVTRYASRTRSERAREAHRRLSPMDNL